MSADITGNMGKYSQGFLHNRTFNVRIGTTISHIFPSDNGTPKGSASSVTLSVLYINDIIH